MRSIILFGIGILIIFTFLQDKGSEIPGIFNNNQTETNKENPKTQQKSPQASNQEHNQADNQTNNPEKENLESNTLQDAPPQTKAQESEITQTQSTQSKEKKTDTKQADVKADTKYQYEPQNTVERIVTNVVADFIKTDAGAEVAKSLIGQQDPRGLSYKYAFATKGFNPYLEQYNIEPVTKTGGAKTLCGQRIKLNYLITNAAGKEVERDIIDFYVGKHMIEEFNILTDGIPKHDMIKARFISSAAVNKILKNDPNNMVTMSVIEHLTEKNFDDRKVKIFDDFVTTARPVLCGDKVGLEYRIYSLNGKLLKEDRISFVTGDFSFPQVVTHMTINMPLTGVRTVILPAKYLAGSEKAFLEAKFSPDEYVMLELSSASIIPKEDIHDTDVILNEGSR